MTTGIANQSELAVEFAHAHVNTGVTSESVIRPKPATRLDFLDGMRALTALYVVGYHALLQVWPILRGMQPHGAAKTLFGWLGYGTYGVVIFLVLSGFCLMLTVSKTEYRLPDGIRVYFWKRILRIVPPYYAAIAFSFLLASTVLSTPLGTHYDTCIPATLQGLRDNLSFIPEMTGSNTNHVFWSVGVEAKIYLLFPIILLLWSRIGGLVSSLLIVLAGVMLPRLVPASEAWMSQYTSLFAMGMLAADLKFDRNSRLRSVLKPSFLVAAIAVGALSWWLSPLYFLTCAIPMHLLVGATAAMAVCLMKNGELKRLRSWLSYKRLIAIGLASYSLYLIHAPMLQLFSKFVSHPLMERFISPSWKFAPLCEYLMFVLIGIPLIVGTSMLFACIFEGKYFRRGMAALTHH